MVHTNAKILPHWHISGPLARSCNLPLLPRFHGRGSRERTASSLLANVLSHTPRSSHHLVPAPIGRCLLLAILASATCKRSRLR